MSEATVDEAAAGLREWARGVYPVEAATEALIRGGYAQSWRPWVRPHEDADDSHWIDFEHLLDHVGAMSGGQQRFLAVVSAIGSGSVAVSLYENFSGIDRDRIDLLLAALAHAAGTHEGTVWEHDDSGRPTSYRAADTLHAWPEQPLP